MLRADVKTDICNNNNNNNSNSNNNNNHFLAVAVVTTLWAGRLRERDSTPDRARRFLPS
jgi:hypothetical protein